MIPRRTHDDGSMLVGDLLLRHGDDAPNAVAFAAADATWRLTYQGWSRQAQALAAHYRSIGPSDAVVVYVGDDEWVRYAVASFACYLAGIPLVAVNARHT